MFDWRRFLSVADELAQREHDEAAQQPAISRAYPAAYGTAARYLVERNVLTTGSINHRSLWQALADPSNRERWSIRAWGFVLKDAREMADYRVQKPSDLTKKVDETLRLSQRLIGLLDRLQAES